MEKKRIKLSLKSYDSHLLDKTVKEIAFAARKTGAKLMGPVPLPNKQKIWTVNTSPHIDKKAREQFELTTHKRIMDILSPSDLTMEALMKLNISSSVEVEIKLSSSMETEMKK
jgi:small subunit ribosomal protein S10